jgi:hypothetical protein
MSGIHPLSGILDDLVEMYEGLEVHHKRNQDHWTAILEVLEKKICD